MKMKKSSVKRGKRAGLPPHSWEPHSLTHAGTINKTFLIIIISLGLLIILVLLLFVLSQFVGRAFYTAQANEAGLQGAETLSVGAEIVYDVKANIVNKETTAFDIELSFPPALLQCIGIPQDGPGWNPELDVLKEFHCDNQNGIITLQRGTLHYPTFSTQEVTFAKITFRGISAGDAVLHFTHFQVLDVGNSQPLSLTQRDATIHVTAAPAPAPAEVLSPGGGGCIRRWNCLTPWSYCNATLQQSRSCTDLNRCDQRKPTKIEVQSCAACEESWICTPWSSCQNQRQNRECVDEHFCGVAAQKPALEKSCQQQTEPAPEPARVQPILPEIQRPGIIPPPTGPSFWEQYKLFLLGIPAALLAVVVIILSLAYHKPKQAAYNIGELQEWVGKEKAMGTSTEDIKAILAQHTGWSKEEIEKVLAGLKETSAAFFSKKTI